MHHLEFRKPPASAAGVKRELAQAATHQDGRQTRRELTTSEPRQRRLFKPTQGALIDPITRKMLRQKSKPANTLTIPQMKSKPMTTPSTAKARTGIEGFDEITGGGLPRGRSTLLAGGAGSGKTIFALQFLVRGASDSGEPGLMVAFEETVERLETNAKGFGWELAELQRKKKLCLIDAQPTPDLIQSGTFDLSGLLAALGAQIKAMGARRIVFDALDIMLALMPDGATKRREIYRLHEWLVASGLTALITSKTGGDEGNSLMSCNSWWIAP